MLLLRSCRAGGLSLGTTQLQSERPHQTHKEANLSYHNTRGICIHLYVRVMHMCVCVYLYVYIYMYIVYQLIGFRSCGYLS